jgi:hypothetical protein
MKQWVFDFETLKNLFLARFISTSSDETKVFIVHRLRNDYPKLIAFLGELIQQNGWLVDFNGEEFDMQLVCDMLQDLTLEGTRLIDEPDGDTIARVMAKMAAEHIERSRKKEYRLHSPRDFPIRHIDLMKMNHWDQKMVSLKWLQFATGWRNLQPMPIHHDTEIHTWEDIQIVDEYCINDVESTKFIMQKSKEQIHLRQSLTHKYGINLMNASEPRISKELFLHFLSEKLKISKKVLKQKRTPRDKVIAKDIILPYVSFKTPEFQAVHKWFSNLVIDYTVQLTKEEREKKYSFKTNLHGSDIKFALGGVHGARPGHYRINDEYFIATLDVKSYYPNLIIRNKWAPAHLPVKEFNELYEWFYEQRIAIPKSDPTNYVLKIILNATFGLSIDATSFLYDPELGMRVTLNGQLLLMMLFEELMLAIPAAIPLMQNTDGMEFAIPRKYKALYDQICAAWQEKTQLVLEFDEYAEMLIWDVNSYIAVFDWKKCKTVEEYQKVRKSNPHYRFKQIDDLMAYQATKCKGRFEWYEMEKGVVSVLHKNRSFLCIPKAVYFYFIHGIPVETYLSDIREIYDFIGAVRASGDWELWSYDLRDSRNKPKKMPSTVRYYMSRQGQKLVKINTQDERKLQVHAGKLLQLEVNKIPEHQNWADYQVDLEFYRNNIYKEISDLKGVKLSNIKPEKSKVYQQVELGLFN